MEESQDCFPISCNIVSAGGAAPIACAPEAHHLPPVVSLIIMGAGYRSDREGGARRLSSCRAPATASGDLLFFPSGGFPHQSGTSTIGHKGTVEHFLHFGRSHYPITPKRSPDRRHQFFSPGRRHSSDCRHRQRWKNEVLRGRNTLICVLNLCIEEGLAMLYTDYGLHTSSNRISTYTFLIEGPMNKNEKSLPKSDSFLFLALLVLMLFSPVDALAQSFMGTYCWNMTATVTTTNNVVPFTYVMKTAVTNMGSNTSFTLIGYVTDPGDNPFTVSGSGQIIGSKLYLDLSGSQRHVSGGWRDTSAVHASLDTSTYSGEFYDVGNDYNAETGQRDAARYTAGTMSIAAACP